MANATSTTSTTTTTSTTPWQDGGEYGDRLGDFEVEGDLTEFDIAIDIEFCQIVGVELLKDDHGFPVIFRGFLGAKALAEGQLNLAIGKDHTWVWWVEVSPAQEEEIRAWFSARVEKEKARNAVEEVKAVLLKEHGLDDESVQKQREALFARYGL